MQTFALIVHELSTNAAKYGALSSAGGEVLVDWQLGGSGNGRYMEFSWREKGGPRVVPATHEGFGLSLITAMGSNGTSRPSIEFAPEGFCCTLSVPLETIAPTRYDRASPMLAAGYTPPRRAAVSRRWFRLCSSRWAAPALAWQRPARSWVEETPRGELQSQGVHLFTMVGANRPASVDFWDTCSAC